MLRTTLLVAPAAGVAATTLANASPTHGGHRRTNRAPTTRQQSSDGQENTNKPSVQASSDHGDVCGNGDATTVAVAAAAAAIPFTSDDERLVDGSVARTAVAPLVHPSIRLYRSFRSRHRCRHRDIEE